MNMIKKQDTKNENVIDAESIKLAVNIMFTEVIPAINQALCGCVYLMELVRDATNEYIEKSGKPIEKVTSEEILIYLTKRK